MKPFSLPSEEELRSVYEIHGGTLSSAARHFSVSNPTIRKWLAVYGIEKKDHKTASAQANSRNRKSVQLTKDELSKLYSSNSIKQIEKELGIGQASVYELLRLHGIEVSSLSDRCKMAKEKQFASLQFSADEILQHYLPGMTGVDLANSLGISASHLKTLLNRHSIKLDPSYRSSSEKSLYEYCVSVAPNDEWQHSNRSILGNLELDIVNHSRKLAIEFCGLYWHSENSSGKDRLYHRVKFERCKAAGYQLITVLESDSPSKVQALIRTKLSANKRIYARNTKVEKITSREARAFHEKHHLSGFVGAMHHYGLLYDDEVVMVASFSKPRFSSKYDYECARMTSHSDFTVVGGASKLFKHFIKAENVKSLITYADLRFGEGLVYLNCGMTRLKDSPPNYWYNRYDMKIESRVKFQKHKLSSLLPIYDEQLTEWDNMKANGYDRIWDCGNAVYELNPR